MKSDADRPFVGSRGSVVRCARKRSGITESTCIRRAAGIPLCYLGSPGVGAILIASRLSSTGVLDTLAAET